MKANEVPRASCTAVARLVKTHYAGGRASPVQIAPVRTAQNLRRSGFFFHTPEPHKLDQRKQQYRPAPEAAHQGVIRIFPKQVCWSPRSRTKPGAAQAPLPGITMMFAFLIANSAF